MRFKEKSIVVEIKSKVINNKKNIYCKEYERKGKHIFCFLETKQVTLIKNKNNIQNLLCAKKKLCFK